MLTDMSTPPIDVTFLILTLPFSPIYKRPAVSNAIPLGRDIKADVRGVGFTLKSELPFPI
jgi:hypothetical protein